MIGFDLSITIIGSAMKNWIRGIHSSFNFNVQLSISLSLSLCLSISLENKITDKFQVFENEYYYYWLMDEYMEN